MNAMLDAVQGIRGRVATGVAAQVAAHRHRPGLAGPVGGCRAPDSDGVRLRLAGVASHGPPAAAQRRRGAVAGRLPGWSPGGRRAAGGRRAGEPLAAGGGHAGRGRSPGGPSGPGTGSGGPGPAGPGGGQHRGRRPVCRSLRPCLAGGSRSCGGGGLRQCLRGTAGGHEGARPPLDLPAWPRAATTSRGGSVT